jgi:hypothetical protein
MYIGGVEGELTAINVNIMPIAALIKAMRTWAHTINWLLISTPVQNFN